ncbi:5'-methylthioadenosine/S-adenosylhomocysteine nucleosidase [Actinoplanes sp. NPDC051470]|uniref:5'-methylthioadenosine/S-adenosylhomocysteine nucleosidase family protein n=1 Tax=Actinoplanes sp. NPDC051470 TaxID=3157224 RepID=UPI00341C650B
MSDGHIVVLTALNLEYEAVHKRIVDPHVQWHPAGTRFETGRLGRGGCQVALALVGKGNHPAAVLAERAISEFAPSAVIFVGVAGALWPNIKLGDVVVASQIYAYHGGTSENDGLKARPRTWETSHQAAQMIQHLIRTEAWIAPSRTSRPHAHFGPIAAGEVVQDSALSAHALWIRQHYNDALAIEMEAAGVAQAGHLNRSLPIVVVRGISDRADGSKSTSDSQNWQVQAARNAAEFAAALAPQLAEGSSSRKAGEMSTGAMYTNIAGGNARVGIQAGQIHGGVVIGRNVEAPPDVDAAISELRSLLKEAHHGGKLDRPTYAAAQGELDTAQENRTDRSRVVLALKRFRGLVADIAEVAKVAGAIIAGLQGLS